MKDSPWINAVHVAFWLFLFCFFIPVCARAEAVTIKYFNEPESICFCLPRFYDTIIMEYVPEDPEFNTFFFLFDPLNPMKYPVLAKNHDPESDFPDENWETTVQIKDVENHILVYDEEGFQFEVFSPLDSIFAELNIILNELKRADYLQEQPIYDN